MIKTSIGLVLAGLVLGVVNQACAVTDPPRPSAGPASPAPAVGAKDARPPQPAQLLRTAALEPDPQAPGLPRPTRLKITPDLPVRNASLQASPSGAGTDTPVPAQAPAGPVVADTGLPPARDSDPGLPAVAPAQAEVVDAALEDGDSLLIDPKDHVSLWDRVRAGFAMADVDSPLVDRHVTWYTQRPDYLQRVVERARRYMHFIVEEVEKRGMPLEIALLPMIESAYNPAAYSKAHAAGMWQFIPTTGRNYGLRQNWWYDGRRDVAAATRAALDYLQKLYGDFGDWQLALAAYNWGEGAVSRAIAANQRSGLPTDYGSLRMPAETRNYLPKLQAVKNIVAEPGRYGLALDELPNEPYFIRVAAPGHIDVKRAAQLAETSIDEFRSLNPAHNRPVITGGSEQSLLIPAEKAEVFNENLRTSHGTLLSWQTYHLPAHERVASIAARFHTTESLIRQVNGIPPRGRLRAGSTILVPRTAGIPGRAATTIDTSVQSPPQIIPDARVHRARRGDTVDSVAAHYGLSRSQLLSWNHFKGGKIRPGQKIALVAPAPKPAHYRKAAGSKRVAAASGRAHLSGRHTADMPKLRPTALPRARGAHLARK